MENLKTVLKDMKLYDAKPDLEELVHRISSGMAILFTGAGFSIGTTNIKNQEPPLAKQLSKEIAKLGNFDEDEDLMFTSDYYLENCDVDPLIDLLKEQFTINHTDISHDKVCKASWRRIYTTNYDNAISFAGAKVGKLIESVSIDKSPEDYLRKHNICVHLNGNITSLNRDTLRSSFKLSNSSYVSHESFTTSAWYYPFKKDIERCSALVFVGYSLYDIDIQKVLFQSPELKNKTYFIVKKDPTKKELFTFSKYGTVYAIGLDEFSKALDKYSKTNEQIQGEMWTESFVEYRLKETPNELNDNIISDFLMHGNIDDAHISNAATGIQNKPFLINRSLVQKVLSTLINESYIVLCSELGNGKTIFCKELMAHLALIDKNVYYLEDDDGDYIGDIEKLIKKKVDAVLVIESYEKHIDMIKYFALLKPTKLKLILTARTSNHEKKRPELSKLEVAPFELNLDFLDKKEIEQFISIIDNIGYWGKEAHYSLEKKKKVIGDVGQGQISLNLLNIFNSPQIKNKINSVVESVCSNENYRKTLFAICLLEILDLPLKPSLISEVSSVDEIYKSTIRQDADFLQLYQIKNGAVQSKSSIFSLHLMNYHFSASFVVNELLDIVKKYNELQNSGAHERELFKSLLRFSFIEKILPDKNKRDSLIRYYEELKIRIPWMKRNPHYWLQYGMSRMMYKDYPTAKAYFDQADALANNIDGYDTSYIDNQRSRLLLLQSLEETDATAIYQLFNESHNLLMSQDDNVYKFRQVALYKDFFDVNYKKISSKNRNKFESACKTMQSALINLNTSGHTIRYDHTTLHSCSEKLQNILDSIHLIKI